MPKLQKPIISLLSRRRGREAAGALEDRPLGVVGEEDIAERGASDSANEGLAMQAEEIEVSALEREAAGVVRYITDHGI